MLGAIVGDIVGSPYEFDENNIKTTKFPLFTDKSVFTDDTVMTVAVARALMDTYGSDDATIENALTMQMRALGRNYPARGYGGMFQAWLLVDTAEAYNSYGNGSAMRVAAAGWLYRTLEETLHAAELTARVTHNHPEGIKGAQAIAAAIFLARLHLPKDDIRAYLSKTFEYDLTRTLKEIRPTYKMDETCQGSVPEAITAFLEGNGFVDVIRKAVSIGGDSDTIACMAGSIAEAYYGIPEQVEKDTFQRLTPDLSATVLKFRRFYLDNSGTPLPGWEESVYYNPDEVLKGLKNLEFAISEFYIKSGSGKMEPQPVLDEIAELLKKDEVALITVQAPSQSLKYSTSADAVQVQCINDSDGHLLLPIFTSKNQVSSGGPELYCMTDSIRNILESSLAADNLYGVIINPFGQNFLLDKKNVRLLVQQFQMDLSFAKKIKKTDD